jgi:hypothetical protein
MNRLHRPHKESGYIAKVEFQETTDGEGRPDWVMIYTPGPKARGEYRTFNRKRGSNGEHRPLFRPARQLDLAPPAPEPEPEPTDLERELIGRGVTASTARELVRGFPEERIAAQVEAFDWLLEKRPKKVKESPGGYLASAIRGDYATPKGFESNADRAKREAAQREKTRQEAEAQRLKDETVAREKAERIRVVDYWESLSREERSKLEAEAIAAAEPEQRSNYENAKDRTTREMYLGIIRRAHIRKLLNLPEQPVH